MFLDEAQIALSRKYTTELRVQKGIDEIIRHFGIGQEETMAFGDGENDLEMIQFAGHGVAMGNACDALKDAADEVTLTNNEDGIAHTLNHLLGCR